MRERERKERERERERERDEAIKREEEKKTQEEQQIVGEIVGREGCAKTCCKPQAKSSAPVQ
jgi:hypothetical protein